VACQGNSDLDGLRADCRGSDNLVASDRDDLVGVAMSRKKVIVKRINAIQNLGAMDVLCTDKTGTLTMDQVILERHCDVLLKKDDGVLALAYMNVSVQRPDQVSLELRLAVVDGVC
jgi:hypothetical protein